MGTILESVNNLSEKLGVEEREQTIKDQLDLCVERLGGEGYSADIAESANKFADKEDGTATFTTKVITENGTYAASDDGVSGYSSVSVDVENSFKVIQTVGSGKTVKYYLINNEANDSTLQGEGLETIDECFLNPVTKIICTNAYEEHVTFTPAENYDGFYDTLGNKITFTGDTEPITNDGYTYYAVFANRDRIYTLTKKPRFPQSSFVVVE